jgi:hypothetical protein
MDPTTIIVTLAAIVVLLIVFLVGLITALKLTRPRW